jgi:hypothetical protein
MFCKFKFFVTRLNDQVNKEYAIFEYAESNDETAKTHVIFIYGNDEIQIPTSLIK